MSRVGDDHLGVHVLHQPLELGDPLGVAEFRGGVEVGFGSGRRFLRRDRPQAGENVGAGVTHRQSPFP